MAATTTTSLPPSCRLAVLPTRRPADKKFFSTIDPPPPQGDGRRVSLLPLPVTDGLGMPVTR
ncbi:MAG: hypothetical protein WC483_03370 [Candidatus Paceibacterota bacterium]